MRLILRREKPNDSLLAPGHTMGGSNCLCFNPSFCRSKYLGTVYLAIGETASRGTPLRLQRLHVIGRKLGHGLGYFVLAQLLALAIDFEFPEISQHMKLG